MGGLICAKHGTEMFVADKGSETPFKAPLRRCLACTVEFRGRLMKAKRPNGRRPSRSTKQIVLPPVIMSERWP